MKDIGFIAGAIGCIGLFFFGLLFALEIMTGYNLHLFALIGLISFIVGMILLTIFEVISLIKKEGDMNGMS